MTIPGFAGEVVQPGDPTFDEHREVWNAMVDRRPHVDRTLHVGGRRRAAVRHGRQSGLEIAVKCGGHSMTGMSVPEGGLMIDLTPMNEVSRRSRPAHRARVQGGSLLRNLDRAAERHGLATTAGNVVAHRRRRPDAGRRHGLAGAPVRAGLRQRGVVHASSPPTATRSGRPPTSIPTCSSACAAAAATSGSSPSSSSGSIRSAIPCSRSIGTSSPPMPRRHSEPGGTCCRTRRARRRSRPMRTTAASRFGAARAAARPTDRQRRLHLGRRRRRRPPLPRRVSRDGRRPWPRRRPRCATSSSRASPTSSTTTACGAT